MIAVRSVQIFAALLLAFILPPRSSMARPRVPVANHPHYDLAFNGDPQLCPKLKNLYDRLLTDAIRRDFRLHRPVDNYLTALAMNNGTRFARVGLRMPSGMRNGPLDDGVYFYSITLDGEPRRIAILDWYRGHVGNFSLFTTIGVLRSGIGFVPTMGGMGPMLPVPPKDVQIEVSIPALSKSQKDSGAYFLGEYLLKKWPNFPKLFSRYEASLREAWAGKPARSIPPVPAISLAGPGLTIRPFQSKDGTLYFVFDDYIGLRQIRDLSTKSGEVGITLVQRLIHGTLEDVCYLVLAPSALAATLKTQNVRRQ